MQVNRELSYYTQDQIAKELGLWEVIMLSKRKTLDLDSGRPRPRKN